jgi:hypothetical protein
MQPSRLSAQVETRLVGCVLNDIIKQSHWMVTGHNTVHIIRYSGQVTMEINLALMAL